MEEAEALEMLIGKAGAAVPVVDVADLKSMWTFRQEITARHPEGQVAVDMGALKQVCRPEADLRAVAHRCAMLECWRGYSEKLGRAGS